MTKQTNKEIPTPICDSEEGYYNDERFEGDWLVPRFIARQLERNLTIANRRIAELEQTISQLRDMVEEL